MLDAISCICQGLRAVFEPIASGLWSRTQSAWNSISRIFSRRSAPLQPSRVTVVPLPVSQNTPTKQVRPRRFEGPPTFRALQDPPLASRALEKAFFTAVASVISPPVSG